MSLKLCYFNGRGLAETSRLLLAVAEQPYTDFRYPLEVIDWSIFKFKKEQFEGDKAAGKLKRSLDKLPYLEVDGQIIPQSKSIERFLARRFGFMGDSEVEAAQIDAICEYIRDFKTEYQKSRALKGEEREAGMTKWFKETLPSKLQALDHIVGENFAVGARTSVADVTLFAFITQFFDNVEGAKAACAEAPHITSVVENVGNLSSIQKWLATRPETPF